MVPSGGASIAVVATIYRMTFLDGSVVNREDSVGDHVALDLGKPDLDLVQPGGSVEGVVGQGFGGPGRATKRCVKSSSTASASEMPSLSMTTKLRQSTALYSLSWRFFR
jgi:hypothetical protein